MNAHSWIEALAEGNGRYIKYAEEVGDGVEPNYHFQGYFVLKKKWRATQLIKWLENNGGSEVSVRAMNGSIAQNDAYLAKEGGPTHEFGSKQGIIEDPNSKKKKTQLWREAIENGSSVSDVVRRYPGALVQQRNLELFQRNMYAERVPLWRDLDVCVLYGDPGVGKSRLAHKMFGVDGVYIAEPSTPEWWPSYGNEDVVVLDDYVSQWPLTRLLRLIDGYRVRLPTKGGFASAGYTKVVFTTNVHPDHWYVGIGEVHRAALNRRITRLMHMHPCGCIMLERYAGDLPAGVALPARVNYEGHVADCDVDGHDGIIIEI